MTTPYQRGYQFELRVRKHLEDKGWFVIRAAGSRSAVDLVALRQGQVLLVQCRRDGRLSRDQRQGLRALARRHSCLDQVASREEDGSIRFQRA